MSRPLRLFWWRGRPNFGDLIAQDIVRKVSGREVVWAPPEECELFAVGSLLSTIKHSRTASNRGRPPWVWGTGNLGPILPTFLPFVRLAAVRGPLTRLFTLHRCRAIGDPALLLPLVLQDSVRRHDRIGVVAHYSQFDRLNLDPAADLDLIDPRTETPMEVVRRIAECRFVFSSSLHGLITADAFGVPNRLLDPTGIHRSPMFKFLDYSLSVGRRLGRPVPVSALAKAESLVKPLNLARRNRIEWRQRDLLAAFPDELRSGADDA